MKHLAQLRRSGALLLATAAAGLALGLPRLAAADAPATTGSWFVFSPPKDGEVLSPQARLKLLGMAKIFLTRDRSAVLAHLQTDNNPFYTKAPPPPTPVVAPSSTSTTSTPSQPTASVVLSDEDKLKSVAETLEPTGILEGAGKTLVTFAGLGGGTIEVGQSFTATLPPDPAVLTVTITDADDSGCTLKLNATTVSVAYVSKPITGSRTASPSPSQSTP